MSFIGNVTPEWIESQYLLWRQNPENVQTEWRLFFEGFDFASAGAMGFDLRHGMKLSGVQSLIYRYRDMGHLLACTDPLGSCRTSHPLLDLSRFGLNESDLDTVFATRRFHKQNATLREILDILTETYCRSIGVEFMHIEDPQERQWLMDRMEPQRNHRGFSPQEKIGMLQTLQEATLFELYLNRRFPGQTRFSLEGGEALIPLLETVIAHAAQEGVNDIVLGMPHRGRLNVQAHVLGKPYEHLFAEFRDNMKHLMVGDGDVKYHASYSGDRKLATGETIHLTLAPNPSHLEAINPVVEGKARARQDAAGTGSGKRTLPLLIHGDAAFAGQGIVAETINLSQLEGYKTGGTLHIVLNNQIGFTTLQAEARSTLYATDVAKMVMSPIFHVHGEDPEAVAYVAELAVDYRQRFGKDVVVELICYRRHGHNEGDEPYFTQPLMYEKIKDRPPAYQIYADFLREEGGIYEGFLDRNAEEIDRRFDAALQREPSTLDTGFQGGWSSIQRNYTPWRQETGVKNEILQLVGKELSTVPEGFMPHPKVAAMMQKRREAIAKGERIDWGTAEALALGSLLVEGASVRLSGQDSRRGTFNHRHASIVDMKTEASHFPLLNLAKGKTSYAVYDSMLSEAAVLGFEYGYSIESPATLTIWEAQYGDFVNGAQVIVDEFIASGETKWNRVSGVVLLLPHGYEGQGPDHSSARIERFLQLAADANMQIIYPTTSAQYFHALRRQVQQPFRKPLIIFTPKSLLRHPLVASDGASFSTGHFLEVLATETNPEKTQAVLFCSGKIYYDLVELKNERGREDVAIIRIEQLYPLAEDLLREELEKFRRAQRFCWVQEEPANMGGWSYIRPKLAKLLGKEPCYVGRGEDASPAVGSHRVHKEQQATIVAQAFA